MMVGLGPQKRSNVDRVYSDFVLVWCLKFCLKVYFQNFWSNVKVHSE